MEIKKNILLAQYTTLKVGGPARFFCEAEDEKEILEALKFAEEKKLPVFILGGGSNILVSDKGFNGLVIKIQNSKFKIKNSTIECGSGCQLGAIVRESVKAGWSGLEWAAGIPGMVGGAIRGNAGAFGSEMKDNVQSVNILEISNFPTSPKFQRSEQFPISKKNPKIKIQKEKPQATSYKLQDCQFSYRNSIFKQNPNLIILSANFKLKKGKKEESEKKIKEILAQRKEKQPFDFPSSGSFFKNPVVKNQKLIEEYEKDTGNIAENNIVPAGYIIETLGLKGKKIGGAMVSQAHGNFLVNVGKAKAEDFIILAAVIKTRVRNKFGIQLKEEVQMVGF